MDVDLEVKGEVGKKTKGGKEAEKENGRVGDNHGNDDAMEIDTDMDMGGQQTEQQPRASSKVMSPTGMAMERGERDMPVYISELLKLTTATADEDIAETERNFRRAEDDLDQVRKKMGWYF